ncbi:MAG: hypothetical protein J7M12_06925, partial [Candidatus Hydrogenedentes bacterium]|nr:hypothetical protein [Candidatus Hydrogenedentota bacterium]
VLGVTVSTNMSAAVGGLLLLSGAIVGARMADRWFSSNPELGPRIVRVIKDKPVTMEETDGQKYEGC